MAGSEQKARQNQLVNKIATVFAIRTWSKPIRGLLALLFAGSLAIPLQAQTDTSSDNLALKKPAIATTSTSPYLPANAFDGDLNTYWRSGPLSGATGSHTQWLEVDLGTPQNVDLATITFGVDTFPRSFSIEYEEVAIDGSKFWSPAYQTKDKFNPSGGTKTYFFQGPVRAQKFRVYMTATEANAYTINEFQLGTGSYTLTTKVLTDTVDDPQSCQILVDPPGVLISETPNGEQIRKYFKGTEVIVQAIGNSAFFFDIWNSKVASLRVQLNTKNQLQLAEVQVFGKLTTSSDDSTNVAEGKATSQSSTFEGNVSSRAVDGKTDGIPGLGTVSITNLEDKPWWKVDLGASYYITKVVLWNRTDCCSDRLSNFHLDYLDANGNIIATQNYPGKAGKKAESNLSAISLKMDANKTLTAQFWANFIFLTTNWEADPTTPGASGSVACFPYYYSYPRGTDMQVTAYPAEGSTFVGWKEDDVLQPIPMPNPFRFKINPATCKTMQKKITAVFKKSATNMYLLNTSVEPPDSTIIISRNPDREKYYAGEQVTLTAPSGIVNWTVTKEGGTPETRTPNPLNILMIANTTVRANYKYTLSTVIDPVDGGTIACNPIGPTYNPGTSVTLTATPKAKYNFVGWEGTDSPSTSPSATVTMNASKTVKAKFSRPMVKLTTSCEPAAGGTIVCTPSVPGNNYDVGDKVTLTTTANSGYKFVNWTIDSATMTASSIILTMDTAKTVKATFAISSPSGGDQGGSGGSGGSGGLGGSGGSGDGSTNVALGKPTSQSSVSGECVSSRAVDGNTDGNASSGSLAHTNFDNQAWWKVDLGAPHNLTKVTLWNRTDCCLDRLSNFHVDYLDANGNVIATLPYPGAPDVKMDINLSAVNVYSVRVQLNNFNYLQLAEVQVFGSNNEGYLLTVNNGSGANRYAAGSIVNLVANEALPGDVFSTWEATSGNPTIADHTSKTTTLTMPANDVVVTAKYVKTGGSTTTMNETEPNNSDSTANGIDNNITKVAGTIGSATDVDYYKIQVGAKLTLTVNMTGPSDKDYELYLYDTSGKLLVGSLTEGTSNESVTYTNTDNSTATYILKVSGYDNAYSTTVPYYLAIQKNAVTPSTVKVTINPTSASVEVGATKEFQASVTGSTNTSVTWTFESLSSGDETIGFVNESGVFHAKSAGTGTLKATSLADSTKYAEATVTVTSSGPTVISSEKDLRNKLSTARDGDVITLCDGIIDINGELTSSANNLKINVAKSGSCILNQIGSSRIMSLSGNDVVIEGITFKNGNSFGEGGGLLLQGSNNKVNNCRFENNKATNGGGLYSKQSITITGSTFQSNYASQRGGGLYLGKGVEMNGNSGVLNGAAQCSDVYYALNGSCAYFW